MSDFTMPDPMPWSDVNAFLRQHSGEIHTRVSKGDAVARHVHSAWQACASAQQQGKIPSDLAKRLTIVLAIYRWVFNPRIGTAEQWVRGTAARNILNRTDVPPGPPCLGGDRADKAGA